MEKLTLKVDGMRCGMCEAHLNDAIRNAFRVKKVSSSHQRGEMIVIAKEAPTEAEIARVIAGTGYTLLSYKAEPFEEKSFWQRIFGK